MACPTIPLSCLDPSTIFAGVYNSNCGGFADPSRFQAEQAIYDSAYSELINNYGVDIDYYVNGFNLSAMNLLYGEHTTRIFQGPVTIRSYLELNEGSIQYVLGGIQSADTITAYMHIRTFTSLFSALSVYPANGQSVEPKPGDKMKITALGCNRPNGRSAKIFEVTEVMDQDTSQLNPLLGHYVWRLKGVRSEFNSETNEPQETVNDQVYDNTFSGKLSSSIFPELTGAPKVYPYNIDTIVTDQIFNQSVNGSNYGNYY